MDGSYDVVVVGGGPAGATAAEALARAGRTVLLLDQAGRIKPCGGAIPPRLIADFAIPDELIVARATAARIISPTARIADMPIEGGYVGMVDREVFDAFLRARAEAAGATSCTGRFARITREDGRPTVHLEDGRRLQARVVLGADGARSAVALQEIPGARRGQKFVFAYHEIIRSPETGFDGSRCDVYYRGELSPDFYGWIFPHGATASIGLGSARKGFSLRRATTALRQVSGLAGAETIRREGAPIPMRPLRRWDNGRDVVLAGDAAGVVAPASGEGIYYAMDCGRIAAAAVAAFCATGDARTLRAARRDFLRAHGRVFRALGMMQRFWYANDWRRERFVALCRDEDIQRMTWTAYMDKRLTRVSPAVHLRIFVKNLATLAGLVPV